MDRIEDGKKVEVRYLCMTERVYALIRENCGIELPPFEKLSTEKNLATKFAHMGEKKKRPVKDLSKPLKDSKRCGKDSKKKSNRAEGFPNALLCYSCGKELGVMTVKSPDTGNKYCSISCMTYVEPDQKPDDSKLELAPQDEIWR